MSKLSDKKDVSMPRPPVRSAKSEGFRKAVWRVMFLLKAAVSSEEHCSTERWLGKSSSEFDAHDGTFLERSCRACIWLRTNILSMPGGKSRSARFRTSSLR